MALDGSFSLEWAVKRFLGCCQDLGSVEKFDDILKKFDDLLKKEHTMTEEEVVNLLVELFLNPKFTILLIGCFRPIAHKIIDRAVVLLQQCNLRSNVDDMDAEPKYLVDKDNECVYLVDYYNQHGKGVELHEFACLAFCRALDLDHSLWRSVSAYFIFSPPPFQRLLRSHTVNELSKGVSQCLLAVRISYRLLLMEPEFFSHRWNWSCFLDLVDTINLNRGNGAGHEKDIADIRWCGVQILSVILKMNDRATENFGIGADEAASCLLRWEEFCQDVAMEKVASYIISSEDAELRGLDLGQQKCLNSFNHNSLISTQLYEVEPAIKSPRLATWDVKSAGNLFVVTPTVKKSFEMVLLAVSQKWPVLLYGPAGSGKTALVNKLARDARSEVLSIHMDDQIDGKTLIGSYVCTEKPGEFRWQPGSLVQAVLNGYWVVFEDIDKASSDVQSILLPLLEGAGSFVTSHGEEIRVAESFRLFSTISTCKNDGSRGTEGGSILSILWRRVMIRRPNNDDLQIILKTWYPDLEPLSGKLVETLEKVNSLFFDSSRRFSLRDLLKWCKRISRFCFNYVNSMLTADQSRCIYQEAVDIFAAQSMSAENRLNIMKEIARLWKVPVTDAGILHPYKPELQVSPLELRIGRVTLQPSEAMLHGQESLVKMRSSLHALERIACSVKYNEPVLLVGETGTGKTTLVQNLAMMLGQRLSVLNLSQQSDVADLLGGFKPMEPQSICVPLYKEFVHLFSKAFSLKENDKLFAYLQKQLSTKNWIALLNGFKKYVDSFQKKVHIERSGSGKKRKKPLNEVEKLTAWEKFSVKLEAARGQLGASSGMTFSFVEGAFITALRNGEWILLDEVNLAPPETLQRLVGVLEGEHGSLCLAERGDASYIARHPNFRMFACMNPATDAGKRDLPYSLRSRFTEYFVDDVLDKEDLRLFIHRFMEESRSDSKIEEKIIDFYGAAKRNSEERLQDGANQKPQYSLRSLYRVLEYTNKAKGKFGFQKAMYDGFSMFFLTLLDRPSAKIMKKMIKDQLLAGNKPSAMPFDAYLGVKKDSISDDFLENYVLTKSVKKQLENLARAVFIKKYPVLLQGPTSSGKTSLVQYLAARTGHEFVRINNHEHTDLQEYLGSYISDAYGKLIFHEGALVKAVRNGYWIVLDELNLAPSDVLEALNRLLDDNRELYVPELRETIRAHPNFMLFATQNPPAIYGGRKMLSRAFRNRFVEVHVDEIPDYELSTIVEKRGKIPSSRAKLMVEVMKELQLLRQSSKVFAGKHGFITPRDLFRWANRLRTFGFSKEVMAEHGYYLLADRLRDEGERNVVQEVLEKLIRVKIIKEDLYKDVVGREMESVGKELGSSKEVILTGSMRRLLFLVKCCFELREPVLLVGETGGGKTTVCQLLSRALGAKLHILNCHQYTETSDFLGGFYPIRERSRLMSEFKHVTEKLMLLKAFIHFPHNMEISSDIGQASLTLDRLGLMSTSYRQGRVSCPAVTSEDLDLLDQMTTELIQLHHKWQTIFMWQDGPLVQAMKAGDLFLLDEISLADDSVLERLNSVLEPERKLSLAEKGGSVMEEITAHENFFVLATMNPGGDYGKKELSPALRNRFTEIWVPPVSDLDELRDIAFKRLVRPVDPKLTHIMDAMLNFWEWFNQLGMGKMLTVRDLISWIEFVKVTNASLGPEHAFLHGLFLVLLDGLCLGTGISKEDASLLREKCFSFILKLLELDDNELFNMENYGWADRRITADTSCSDNMLRNNVFGIHPFYIEKGYEECDAGGFEFLAPTTRRNALRVLRAMQLPKPVLLEGSPGVGKTSLIIALGKYSGHKVVRINLSEQTDLMDLLGSDLPVDSDEGMKFAWSDGILLQALKEGCWVLLDELNLAPQSVLEGLNAILDHRAEVFIPELGLTFKCPPSFRIFACQNPFSQGGGRKGLPRSFLNRFTKVYIDELAEDDYLFISSSLYPSIPRPVLSKLISFNKRLHEEIMLYHKFAQNGSPWEFNLRDVLRSCQIIQGVPEKSISESFVNILYVQRMRTAADRQQVLQLYEEVFGEKPLINPYPRVELNPEYLFVGTSAIKRNTFQSWSPLNNQLNIMPYIRHSLEAVAHSVEHQWLCILVGPSSSGKTSLIRLLAQLTGNVLNELNLSSATDISELLGCFEQYNAYRNIKLIVAKIEQYVNQYFSLQLKFSKAAFVSERKGIIAKWFAFLSATDSGLASTSNFSHLENWGNIIKSLSLLVDIIEQLKSDMENYDSLVSGSTEELDRMKAILKLQIDQKKESFSAKFEWVTGLLIKAIENGEWLVLENANLCNPTVLDRINSLVEPSGSITINERGIVDGSPMVIFPHPNFRMFLTVNPSYGEVSRAMRNRGVEIFLMQPYWLLDEASDHSCAEFELKDVKRFITLSDIPFAKLVDSMAKAHLYARNEGRKLDVQVTYLELSRWIQLFQHLLRKGNQTLWSLQISWEHTYLSSLGEAMGWEIINYAKVSYLSREKLPTSNLPAEFSLYVPEGWLVPLKVRDFILYSRETSVKQNCLYLEYLVAQCELGETWNGGRMDQVSSIANHEDDWLVSSSCDNSIFDWKLINKMIFFATNWAIEQAHDGDYNLYFLCFDLFSSKLQHCSRSFSSFFTTLKQGFEHPIWKHFFSCQHKLSSLNQVDRNLQPIPLLSLGLINLNATEDVKKASNALLYNAMLSYQQWNAQSAYQYSYEARHFRPVLESLQMLEREILDMLVQFPSNDVLSKLYSDLVEDHIFFWDTFVSSQDDALPIAGPLLIAWHSLTKDISRLHNFCPRAADNVLLMASKNLDKVFTQRSEQSLLWFYGGHPILPASEDLSEVQKQLLDQCESIWPTGKNQFKQVNDGFTQVVASSGRELRFLALKGISMSSYITSSKSHEEVFQFVQQLKEMGQMLMERLRYEKHKLEVKLQSDEHALVEENLASCCVFSPEILCTSSGYFSWQETVPILDGTSLFLDRELLQKLLSLVLVDPSGLQQALRDASKLLLEFALKFSLTSSTRPPQNFVPHQKILWILDAWTAVNDANGKITSYVLEMWSCWHCSLWNHCPEFLKNLSKTGDHDIPQPDMLFQPIGTATVCQILQSTCAIKDYFLHSLKLKVASCNFWQSFPGGTSLNKFLLFVGRSLFEQIIYAHKKAFNHDKFARIKSIFCSFQNTAATEEVIQELSSLIASSSHQKLKSSLKLFIEPVLGELYLPSSSPDLHLNIGYAWLRVGGLRFNLLLSCNNLDPAMKYSCKDKQIEGKISSLELEIKVREECNYIAGWPSSRMADKNRTEALERLKAEHQRLQRKLVFRCNPSKYSALRKECEEFWELSHLQKVLSSDGIKVMEKQEIFDQLCNWQEIATAFINRLADEYKDYSDVAQPFQVAVYEMKLGLSLLLSGALQKKFLNQIEEDNMDQVTESIYSFLRFPGGHAFKSISFDIIDVPTNFWELETSLVEKLVPFAREEKSEQVASFLHQKPAFHQNILAHVVRFVADSHRIDHASFKTLTSIFYQYACKWLSFKVKTKEKGGHDVQEYKFRPRAFMIKSVVDVDISALGKLFSDDSFMEWQELLSEEEYPEKIEPSAEDESLEEEWNLMGEPSVNSMVHIHNQLFGSNNLIQNPQTFYISDADRLLLFTDSYRLGAGMIRGLKGLHASSLDAKLVPEHLLRLCLEHERMVGSSQKQCSNYNFYKDSNTPVMAKMVKLLTTLQQQILVLLNEWEDHPALKKIMDVIDMLLAIPMDTPLAKALSGLQFLLNRARVLQENGSKFPLSDQMQPMISLVCSWKKMELDSWPALLDDVQDQYEINAAKLWFPLYSLLHHHDSGNLVAYEQSTIESLEEFIRTSSVGEFQKRLQLLFAFHGQITNGVCLEADTYASPRQEVNLKILYNVFGYYVQFLPRIMELIKVNRRNIEKELTEVVKLCHWERTEACLSVENSKRTRQKLKKLIQKYTDFLQQPVMLVLNHEVEQTRINIQTLQGPRPLNGTEKNASLFDIPVDLMPLSDKKRSAWFSEWSKKREHTLQNLDPDWTSNLNFLNYEDVSIIRESLATESKCLLHWRQWDVVCQTLERIHQTAIECDELWKEAKNNLGKKRAFSELLKLLESSGLHKHKFEIIEASNDSKWFSEPAYNSEHLLLTQSRLSYQDSDTPAACLPNEYLDREWKTANQLYFQSLASVQHLLHVRLRPHEDITNEQVNRAVSFVSHLINMQQKQRASAYAFAKSLNCLREYVSALEKLYTKCTGIDQINRNECSIARNKSDLFKCLWKQKLLFDGLTAMLVEESLVLKMVESTHLKSCQIVKPSANHAVQFIENFIPIMQRSKELLDSYLLGRGGSTCANPICPYVIPKQMQELAGRNFEVIRKFEVDFHKQDFNRSSVMGALFGHFDDPIKKGKLLADQFKQFDSGVQEKHESLNSCEHLNSCSDSYSDLESEFDETFKKTLRLIMDALRQCSTGNGNAISEESLGKITSWEYLFTSSVANLNLEEFCKNLLGTITYADKLVNHSETDASCLSNKLGACFEHLHALSDLMLHLSDGLLQDLLTLHETVSVMTLILANVFAALFSKGFGIPVKDLVDDASHDISQNASGTGMGEGCGLNDISDQITDEDQLLGTSEKPGEEDASDKIPSKNDKGIEMEQDFEADAFSVSEDSEEESAEDNEGNEDEQLESATGNGGADSEVVDEKLWDKEEDENPDNKNEKYESGPSVRDRDVNSRELRAKDDSAALAKEKPAELDSDEIDKQNHEVGNQDDISDKEENGVDKEENGVDVSMDKEEAFADPTGIKLDEPNQGSDEDMDMDEDMNEGEDLDSNEEIGPEEDNVSGDNVNREEDNISPTDETMEEAENQPADGASEKNGLGGDSEEKSETNAMAPRKDVGMGIFDMISAHKPNAKSATQPYGDMQASASQNNTPEANMSATGEAYNNLAPLRGLPSGDMSEMDVMLPDQSFSGRFTDQRKSEFPLQESSTRRESQLNPYRNVGDALEEWKERVKVSVDLQPGNEEVANEIEDKNADEYGYVPEFEKGTAQALGSATSEQSDANVNGRKPDEDGLASQRDDAADMEIEKQSSGEWQIKPCVSNVKNKMGQQTQISDFEKSERERSPEVHDHDDIEPEPENISESLVSVRRSYLSKSVHELSKLSVDDIEMENAPHPEEVSIDIRSNAAVLWRKYELVTTRLSHELAEQLRLVMEPTLASKLQGDYKTGKRINMKKVIPYIASHYRKDKIWLRRTRPNRRDYQVVLAVDDSRSMSESCCGDVAVEALVTVCRAMSLLEMGNLAVASFGKKGNVRLLHDFDQPFTGEAGINIISNLTFRQENTIADEPVVDLLRHLNNMLDVAVARARLPSGQNPLQQLVLIIADGRFHEKEKLKRCVRDFLSQKRMVAFLLLDSPQESIMDHMEASFVGEGEKRVLKFTKYLDSFPFPYYIVLRNIEALPRTLADLLRQWFELMQHAKD